MTPVTFPDGFIWGTATAAHQIEGGNWNSDWWAWEHHPDKPCAESSGDACDSLNRYRDDIDLVDAMGLSAYRFSLEWSRIEPERGEFSTAALDHYRRVCAACHERGITPIVTYNHFTLPRWVAHVGGWEEPDTADLFARYCERAVAHIGDLVGWSCTLNEPNIVATAGYLAGVFPPGRRDVALRRAVNDCLIEAHRGAVEAIRSGPGDGPVGLTLSMTDYQAVDGGEGKRDRIRHNMEDVFLEAVAGDDFIGVQTYSRSRVGPDGTLGPEDGVPVVTMGYELWPEALEATVRRAADVTGLPVLITENGIGTDDDQQRIEYVTRALEGVGRCLADGLDVRGYIYWSLMDNFEWARGYEPRFGLHSVDRTTFERQAKPSAEWFGGVVRANALP